MEEFVLIAVAQLGRRASGSAIRDLLEGQLGERISIGGIYVPLDRLVGKGLLDATLAEPTAERGGRRKKLYRLTSPGIAALKNARQVQARMWKGLRLARETA